MKRNQRHERDGTLPAIVCLMTAVFSVLSTACPRARAADDQLLVGFSMDTLVVERWEKDRDYFVEHAEELGAQVIVRTANEDPVVQAQQILELIGLGVDVLVVIPNDAEALTQPLQTAHARDISVVAYDRIVRNAPLDLYVSFDNVRVGEMMASALFEAAGSGNYLIINGAINDYNCVMFHQGYMNVLQPLVDGATVNIVDDIWLSSWRNTDALNIVNELLSRGVHLDAILAANDFLAEQAIRSLAEHRLAGEVAVVGMDAELAACQRIVEGTQVMTVYKPIRQLAYRAAEAAVSLARGEEVGALSTIDNGFADIPYDALEPMAVTRSNMDATIIASSFHSSDDVYRR